MSDLPETIQPGERLWSQAMPWGLLLLSLLLAYLTRGVLLPFAFGFAVAYLLDPVADRLEAWGVPRAAAAAIILALFFLTIIGLMLAIWPLLFSQITGLASELPAALSRARPLLENLLANLSERMNIDFKLQAEGFVSDMAQQGLQQLSGVLSSFISGGLAFFSLLGLLLISPVVAFYLLRDYDVIVAGIDDLLPSNHKAVITAEWSKIDRALSGFVRGQIIICTIMGALYALGWSLIGLNYGLVLGILAGVLSFIPFVGMIAAAVIAMLVALGQFGTDPLPLGMVFGVYVLVQILEGSVLTPRIVGTQVGLHPVWVLFAVFAGGEVAGFVGVLVAVPAAAVIGVLVRFTVDRYIAPRTRADREEAATAEETEPPSDKA